MSIIEIQGLTKRYGDRTAVDNLSLKVYKGEILGIIGPNGAGKTTTIEMLTGFRKPDAGTIQMLGIDPVANPYRVKEKIGVLLQSTGFYDKIKVKEALELFASYYQKKRPIQELITLLGLKDHLHKYVKKLSGGLRQRVAIAIALVNDPEIVFLDEPSTGLDPEVRREFWTIIRKLKGEGKTIILTTHYMEEAQQLSDRIAVFKSGKILACDTPERLISHLPYGKGTLEDVYLSMTGLMREEVVV